MAANPCGRHGAVICDPKALSLDAAVLREQTRAYTERFNLREDGEDLS